MAVSEGEYIVQLTSPTFLVLAKSRFFLFSYSEKGARAAGILMTVIRTARLNQADPEKYIAYVLTQLGKTGQEDIGRLLPWSERGKAIEIRGTEEGRGKYKERQIRIKGNRNNGKSCRSAMIPSTWDTGKPRQLFLL